MGWTPWAVVKGSAHGEISKALTLVGLVLSLVHLSFPALASQEPMTPGHDMRKALESISQAQGAMAFQSSQEEGRGHV